MVFTMIVQLEETEVKVQLVLLRTVTDECNARNF